MQRSRPAAPPAPDPIPSVPAAASTSGPAGTGVGSVPPRGLRHAVRAFRNRDFAIFWTAALVSNSGTWLQNLTVPYVLYQLTGSAFWVGAATFCQFMPSMLLGPVGGSFADRYDRRRVLLVTQSLMAVAALSLWGVWASGFHNAGAVLVLVAVSGAFSGLNIPSWQSFIVQLVPREHLLSAITLNSVQFNAARAVGPAVAGLLLATLGAGGSFLLNGLSFGAVRVALLVVRGRPAVRRQVATGSVASQFREALVYSRRNTGILAAVVVSVLVGALGNPLTQFTVVFAEDVFDVGALGLGLLTGSLGLGAILCAPVLSGWADGVSRGRLVQWSLLGYGLAIAAFGLAPVYPLGVVALIAAGAGFLAVISSTNTAIQLLVDEHMRGRVMAVRVMSFTGAFPVGALVQGWLADHVGPRATVTGAGLLLFLAAVALASRPAVLARLDQRAEPEAPAGPVPASA